MRYPTAVLMAALTAVLGGNTLRAGETVVVEHLGLRLTLPAGFVAAPQPVPDRGHVVFTGPKAPGVRHSTLMSVARAQGVNGWDTDHADDLAAALPEASAFTETWQGTEVVGLRMVQGTHADIVTLSVGVQHGKELVHVAISGDLGGEAELRGLLRAVLADLELDANLLTPESRRETFEEGVGTLSIAAVAVFAVVFALQYLRDRLRPHRKPRRGSSTYDGPRVYHE